MTRPTQLIIDLHALNHNFRQIRHFAPKSKVMAMVKADAYGHGAERIAQALDVADALGVASLEEALSLRRAGVRCPIVLMEGLFTKAELIEALAHQFILVLHHEDQLAMLEESTQTHTCSVWVKINTGMCRLGFSPEDFSRILPRLNACEAIQKPMGWMTHFAEADNLAADATLEQIALFHSLIHDLPGPQSLANSAGILGWPKSHATWVRPGIMLYGISPFKDKKADDYQLLPVMTLQAKLIAIHKIKKGARIGYGGTWVAPEDMLVGVVSAGYGDGYPQFTKTGTPILVNNKICPLVGRVSMDMLTIDLRSQPQARIGDPVILWGKGLPIEIIALASNTSAYELVTRMTHRPPVETI